MDMNPKTSGITDIFHEFRRRRENPKPIRWVSNAEAPVKEVVLLGDDIDLGLLPITHQAALNSDKYIPVGQMICKDPDTGVLNAGMYRHEVKGRGQLGAMINPVHHAAYIARCLAALGKPMEVVIVIGHHPAVALGTLYEGPLEVDELEVSGGFLGESLEVVKAETVNLPIPAYAEIAIEGIIDPQKMTTDGPFSEWTGYYGEEHECYLIQVTGISMRRDAIYHDMDPSQREHNLASALAYASVIYDSVKRVVPSVRTVFLPPSGGSLIAAYVSISKRVPGEGKRAGLAALTAVGSIAVVVVVDEDVDVYNEEEVLWAIYTRATPDKDIDIIPHVAGGHLIPTAYDETGLKRGKMTSKMIIDATQPVELPFATRIIPDPEVWEKIKLEDYIKDNLNS
jgi:2,5-furandicarboxylate decarboxylase 1